MFYKPLPANLLTEGGESFIYLKNGDNTVYKVLKNPSTDKQQRILKLRSYNLPSYYSTPKEILEDNKGKFIGFSMNKLEGEDYKSLINKKYLASLKITNKEVIKSLISLYERLDYLHQKKILIGDFSDTNVLFNPSYEALFIDCDSWQFDQFKTNVYTELFVDPLCLDSQERFKGYTLENDIYSFSIIAWNLLTKIHPFSGTYKPQDTMNIVERKKRKISLIDNKDVIIPKMIKDIHWMGEDLVNEFKTIFEKDQRVFNITLLQFLENHLKYDSALDNYVFDKVKVQTVSTLPSFVVASNDSHLVQLLGAEVIKTVINRSYFVNKSHHLVFMEFDNSLQQKELKTNRTDIMVFEDIYANYTKDKFSLITDKNEVIKEFPIQFKSNIEINKNHLYFISKGNVFTRIVKEPKGFGVENLSSCSIRSQFKVSSDNSSYCLLNRVNEDLVILNINNHNFEYQLTGAFKEALIAFDEKRKEFLVIIRKKNLKYVTLILDLKANLKYVNTLMDYQENIEGITFNEGVIFHPRDQKISAFSYLKNKGKDFLCQEVNEMSLLKSVNNKILIFNSDNIWKLG